MTEDEARTKWCITDVSTRCRSSECIAWRWIRIMETAEFGPNKTEEAEITNPENAKYISGYCGLVGKPEVE